VVLAERLMEACSSPILGIGVGTPGLVDPNSGAVHRAVNLNWTDVPLQDMLQACSKKLGSTLPVYVVNDCHAAALAEFHYGKPINSDNLVVLKSGQGIGAGIVIHRQLYAGDGWGTGEIGHLNIIPGGEICSCGNRGCLETVASNRAIARRALAAGRMDVMLAERPANELFLRLIEGYHQGDPAIQQIVGDASQGFGAAISSLITILNIHHVVLNGEITAFGEVLRERIQQEVRQRSLPALAEMAQVSFSRLGSDIVMLGAAALVLSKELALS
jgi:predicted NBD/HSP70 family sugar kinase